MGLAESLQAVGVGKKRENQPSLLFALSARCGPAASVSGQSRKGSHQSLCGQRSFQHPAGCPSHWRGSAVSLSEVSPRASSWGSHGDSEHSADSDVSCFSGGSATLGSGRKEADRGRGRASRVAKSIPEEVTSSRLALSPALGKHSLQQSDPCEVLVLNQRGVCC